MDDKFKFQVSGLKWLYELELIHDPQIINNLKLNILSVSKYIREVELLSSYEQKSMLIYLDLKWLGRKFFRQTIEEAVTNRVHQLLPRFRLRVVSNYDIFKLALELVTRTQKGEENEVANNPTSNASKPSSGLAQD